jgi:hypothetical protein
MKSKKMFLSLFVLFGFLAVSCGSTSTKSFEERYDKHRDNLDLTGAKKHTVVKGETLVIIARKYYGDERRYFFPLIMAASSENVMYPDIIEVDTVLTVPDLDLNLKPPFRANLKGLLLGIADFYQSKDKYKETQVGLRAEANKL